MQSQKQKRGLLTLTVLTISLLAASFVLAAGERVVVVPLTSRSSAETIVTTVGPESWFAHASAPSTITRFVSQLQVAADGVIVMAIQTPFAVDNVEYGLESVEICLELSAPSYLTGLHIYRTESATATTAIVENLTDRTTSGCYVYPVGTTMGKGAGIALEFDGNGSFVRVRGTTFTWKKADELTPATRTPAAGASRLNGE